MSACSSEMPTMTLTQRNPSWLDPARYVELLNLGFPGQWDRTSFDWYVARGFNGRDSELLVRTDGTQLFSGMTLCYRQVKVGATAPIEVCVLSAGATVPSERGKGHYESLLRAALEHVSKGPCAALIGFVTRHNASGRGLFRLGAHAIPSFYVVSPEHVRHRFRRSVTRLPRRPSPPFAQDHSPHDSLARFHYERPEDWVQQFVHRPNAVRAIRLGHDSQALIEEVGETDRLQWLACPDEKRIANVSALAATSAARGRKFFLFTLDPLEAAAARRLGLRVRDGYMILLPTHRASDEWRSLVEARWSVQSGDRL